MIEKNNIRKIFIVSLTNIGDIVLTTPAIERIKQEFLPAKITILVGPEGRELFTADQQVEEIIIYNKHAPLKDKLKLVFTLRRKSIDLVVDFRNTLWPYIIGTKYRNLPFLPIPAHIKHKACEHLDKLKSLGLSFPETISPDICTSLKDDKQVAGILEKHNLLDKKIAVICPGSKSRAKRWREQGFAFVADRLNEINGVKVVMLGSINDQSVIRNILTLMKTEAVDLSGKTTIRELVVFFRKSRLLITNDTAPMHLGWAAGVPMIAIFGPTDPAKFAPLTGKNFIVSSKIACSPCGHGNCRIGYKCMKEIDKNYILTLARKVLVNNAS
ncbi:MAG: glycosyltransferase family 9 protein [Candidatus Omnitrophota bacterium]